VRKPAAAILTAALLGSAAPLGAITLVERGASFQKQVTFTQAVLCDGSVRLAPGTYKVQIASLGDGSVRASFFDSIGRKAGEANGIIIVNGRSAGEAKVAPGGAAAKQNPGPPDHQATFSSLGFHANSPATFRMEGSQVKLVVGGEGANQILIGLLLPAVNRGDVKLVPAVQKVR
jgi:hypothetical protein